LRGLSRLDDLAPRSAPVLALPACVRCPLGPICRAGQAGPGAPSSFSWRRLASGETLFNQGDLLQRLFVVRSGSLKQTLTLPDGREQVCGFSFPGDPVGLDALADVRHACAATATEDSLLCSVGHGSLQAGIDSDATLARSLSRHLSDEIVRAQRMLLLLGSLNAQERMAAFLLELSGRFGERGLSTREFHLVMKRADIGSYLGLALETVSRTLSLFQSQGLLRVDNRSIRFVDLNAFALRFAGCRVRDQARIAPVSSARAQ
jgi:CRP/FNR family transcriptional regulator